MFTAHYSFQLGTNTLRPAVSWAQLCQTQSWQSGTQGGKVVVRQLTRVSFASGPWTACSPHVSWVKTLVQIREAGSKYVVALPHAPKETTPRDIAS